MCGVAARRKADTLIAAGRVTVNGVVPPPGGTLVQVGVDVVAVDGRPVEARAATRRYYAVNKPAGYLSAVSDHSRRPLVLSLVAQPAGLHPVGRLDLDSHGLILVTDDGELSFRLQHPRHHVEKEYQVRVKGKLDRAALRTLREGVQLEEGRTSPAVVEVLRAHDPMLLRLVLKQGWNRQIRRMVQAVGGRVDDLERVRVGPVRLGDLPVGQSRLLKPAEVAALRLAVDLDVGAPP